MNRLPLLLTVLLTVPSFALAASVPVRTALPSVRPDLLLSVRSHAAPLSRQPIVSVGISVRTPQTAPPSFAAPPLTQVGAIVHAPASDRR